MTVMFWRSLYFIGILASIAVFVWKDDSFGSPQEKSESSLREGSVGRERIVTLLLWPIFLPLVFLMLVKAYACEVVSKKRIEKWRKKE